MPFKPLLCSLSTSVIYHYCVIVEMFCIGLYARHTFRKVESSMMENVEGPISVWQMEKAVQTDVVLMTPNDPSLLSEEAQPSHSLVSASNSNSEDSLCRIEHAPMDDFPFPQTRSQQSHRPKSVQHSSAEEPGVDLTHFIVRVDINNQDSQEVTVVWQIMKDLQQKTKYSASLSLKRPYNAH